MFTFFDPSRRLRCRCFYFSIAVFARLVAVSCSRSLFDRRFGLGASLYFENLGWCAGVPVVFWFFNRWLGVWLVVWLARVLCYVLPVPARAALRSLEARLLFFDQSFGWSCDVFFFSIVPAGRWLVVSVGRPRARPVRSARRLARRLGRRVRPCRPVRGYFLFLKRKRKYTKKKNRADR